MSTDLGTDAIEHRTADGLNKLAKLRGITAVIAWDGEQYTLNGTRQGRSSQGVFAWIEAHSKGRK